MSVFGLTIEYGIGDGAGDASLQRFQLAMERFGEGLSDFGKFVFPNVLEVLEKQVDEQFDARGHGPVAGPWAPLSPKYAKWKEVHFPGMPILERTGVLRAALTQDSGPNAMRDYSAAQLNFGTIGVPYASFHQTGAPWLPVRAPFDFGPEFDDRLKMAMQKGVIEAAREAELEVTP